MTALRPDRRGRRALLRLAALSAAAQAAPRWASAASSAPGEANWVHAYAAFDEPPKYPREFKHFDYVNPDAPKGGILYLRNPDRRSSFDKFNPFTLRGNAPAGLSFFMFESLTTGSADELRTMYGQLASEMLIAPDRSSINFRLHPKARFANGDPVLAADVKHSFDSITGPYASPTYQTAYAGVERAVVVDERTIRFDLKDRSDDTLFAVGGVPVFSRKWGLKPDGTSKRFDEIIADYPVTSGPYTIAEAHAGRRIEFKRDPTYWARDLPLARGFFNFDRVVYRYYKDEAVATEAFKAGEFDIFKIYGARTWIRQMKGEKFDDGRILKDLFPVATGQGLQADDLNLRRPIFQDRRVRKAIGLTWDFDSHNRYGLFHAADSLFNNSDFAAQGLPSPGELALLEPYRDELPKEVFGPPFVQPRTGRDPAKVRANLIEARDLLDQAGWKLGDDGRRRNAKGEAFEFEYMTPNEGARDAIWGHNLDKLGIKLNVRQVDFALYRRRLAQYDFDVVTIVEGTFTIPSALDYLSLYGSKSADEKGNNNFRGVKSKAVDHIIDAMARAKTLPALRDACRALDRVVMWNYWQVPELYFAAEPACFWNKFAMPKVRPKYYTIDNPNSGQLAWPILTWWIKPGAVKG